MENSHPFVLCLSGHDPSGGAGIQADIETLASHQCRACSVITALTVQDTKNVHSVIPLNPDDFLSQARIVLEDLPVSAVKIGLIADKRIALCIETLLKENPRLPVVLDPVLAAGGGANLADSELLDTLVDKLLPLTTVLTPNSQEARKLTGENDLDRCGLLLLEKGCDYVLITGAHENDPIVSNRLFHRGRQTEIFDWDRLPESYHGSGCTLSSSIAALLAQGIETFTAILEAQEYTWNALNAGWRPGKGQHLPNRFFWMKEY
ncbi:MAG: bifunctional hydroxymethylpyrimidine kinase/phosphomethylpyrimidine kinase [Gammaproteobacteria bacterium]